MQYSPKLKRVMEEIKNILEREDIAAAVILHTPGFSEYLNKIDPSYSAAWFEYYQGQMGIRFRARAADFNGDKEKCKQAQESTLNMLHHLGHASANAAMMFMEAMKAFSKNLDIEYTDGGHASHEQQNN